MNSRNGSEADHQQTDAELVSRFLDSRDELAFRLLWRRHAPRLLRLLIRLTGGHRLDAEDLLQEAWLKATDHLATLRQREKFFPWIREITVGVHADSVRRGLRRNGIVKLEPYDDNEQSQRDSGTGGFGDQDAALQDLEKCIARLPDGYRAVVVLHDVEGFKHEEIAAMLHIAAGTSKSQLFAARRALRAMMQERSDKEQDNVGTRQQ
jgi:RNA polymerase sigma-70 factor (ECF subfamily)